ncbi:uncharacterized protein LOC129594602 [Paramacrobiotus metropolitanus]|uniref:uncharacterized protein LOC129594602 n=1 Tax=Paramacrobiotus metropolitanus TaxID=2943436 RepID=UPI0024461FF6|nr:uncharacterized protein LOC129594602 [Paramacrobiotus metropolitanus]
MNVFVTLVLFGAILAFVEAMPVKDESPLTLAEKSHKTQEISEPATETDEGVPENDRNTNLSKSAPEIHPTKQKTKRDAILIPSPCSAKEWRSNKEECALREEMFGH